MEGVSPRGGHTGELKPLDRHARHAGTEKGTDCICSPFHLPEHKSLRPQQQSQDLRWGLALGWGRWSPPPQPDLAAPGQRAVGAEATLSAQSVLLSTWMK